MVIKNSQRWPTYSLLIHYPSPDPVNSGILKDQFIWSYPNGYLFISHQANLLIPLLQNSISPAVNTLLVQPFLLKELFFPSSYLSTYFNFLLLPQLERRKIEMQHKTSGGMVRGISPALPLSPNDSMCLKDCFTSQASVSSCINIKGETK